MPNVQLAWALQRDQIKHIDEVENGIKCDCTCPQCGDKLIARNRGLIKSNHFAHTTDTFCEGAAETAIHLAAKDIIASSNEILTPTFFTSYIADELSEKRKMDFGEVSNRRFRYEEAQLETSIRNFRPDVELIKGDIKIYIEITVTNKSKKSKIVDFQKNGELLFEINLENIKEDLSRNEFKKTVLFEKANRRWLVLSNYDLSEYQKKTVVENNISNPFSGNPTEFTEELKRELKKHSNEFIEIMRQFLFDLDELKKATFKGWRENRLIVLEKKNIREIISIKEEKYIEDQYFAPRISNVWALNCHSHIWQAELVKRFIFNQNYNRSVYYSEVLKWFRSNYSMIPYLERLNNLELYSNHLDIE